MSAAARWSRTSDWLGVASRLLLAAAWGWAGASKTSDPGAAEQAVRAYRLLPQGLVQIVGFGLPFLELALAALLIVGLGVRAVALVSAVLLLVYIAAIASVWARGIAVDCGCFGGGGPVTASHTAYGAEILRDLGLLLPATWLIARPHNPWSLDRLWLPPNPTPRRSEERMSRQNLNGKNLDAKRDARGRLRQQLVREQATARKKRAVAVAGSAVAVLVLVTAIGIAWQSGRTRPYDPATDAPAGATGTSNLTIPLGMPAPATLTVYEDPRCPACGQFEKTFHTSIERLEQQGRLRVEYHIVSFIDRHDHGHGSENAANALACAANAGRFAGLHDLLYARRPDETDDAWASAQTLTQLAVQVPGLDTAAFRDCTAKDSYSSWVTAVQADFDRSGYTSTPTVLLNGVPAYPTYHGTPTTPDQLAAWVQATDHPSP